MGDAIKRLPTNQLSPDMQKKNQFTLWSLMNVLDSFQEYFMTIWLRQSGGNPTHPALPHTPLPCHALPCPAMPCTTLTCTHLLSQVLLIWYLSSSSSSSSVWGNKTEKIHVCQLKPGTTNHMQVFWLILFHWHHKYNISASETEIYMQFQTLGVPWWSRPNLLKNYSIHCNNKRSRFWKLLVLYYISPPSFEQSCFEVHNRTKSCHNLCWEIAIISHLNCNSVCKAIQAYMVSNELICSILQAF